MVKVNKIHTKLSEQNTPLKYEKTSDNIIKFIGSDFFAIAISILLTILQSFHPAKVLVSFQVFDNIYINNIFCYSLTFLIELFVLYYVIRTEVNISKGFMVFSMFINCYYYLNKFNMLALDQFVFDFRILPAFAFSTIIPYGIFKVSEQINKTSQTTKQD